MPGVSLIRYVHSAEVLERFGAPIVRVQERWQTRISHFLPSPSHTSTGGTGLPTR